MRRPVVWRAAIGLPPQVERRTPSRRHVDPSVCTRPQRRQHRDAGEKVVQACPADSPSERPPEERQAVQIIDRVTFAVAVGDLEPGTLIPSVRDIAQQLLVGEAVVHAPEDT